MNVLVTGAGGMLALAMLEQLRARGHAVVPCNRADLDVTDADAVDRVVTGVRPDAIIQCAAYTGVDAAESHEADAFAVNAYGTAAVARAAAAVGARFVYPSTDYVFDGCATKPYPPDHATAPVNAYGRSKLAGEQAARAADALVVRTSWLYGPRGNNFVRTIVRRARADDPLRVVDDQRGAPTATTDLARMIVILLERGAPAGTWHATNDGQATWYELACETLRLAAIDAPVGRVSSAEFAAPARRPAWSVLDCTATWQVTGTARHWRDALAATITDGLLDA